MSADDAALAAIRQRIDNIDAQLQALLNERAGLAMEAGKAKQMAVQSGETPVFYRPEREAQILARLQERNAGPLPNRDMARLFREIISCCLSLEQPLKIAFLGPPGTYTEMAAVAHFGQFVRTRPLSAINDVFREVETAKAGYGVVPVENSTEGMVNHTLDCFMAAAPQIRICAEVELPIHHAFLVHKEYQARGVSEETRKEKTGGLQQILSHGQSLAQCRRWLEANFPGVERIAVASNAEAARQVAENPRLAAIAGNIAAQRYGLRMLAENIEDRRDNKTRFLVIGCQDVRPSGRDKTSILVSTRNRPGALYHVLAPFRRREISLSRIETRPARSGDWSYVFFIDFDGHQQDGRVQRTLAEVGEVALEVRCLGSYPRAVL